MLVLSRNIDETIMIGDNIRICVVDIQHNRVRLGIEAPQEIPVHRQEVYEALKKIQASEEFKRDEAKKNKHK